MLVANFVVDQTDKDGVAKMMENMKNATVSLGRVS
jgi:hypothetical protein